MRTLTEIRKEVKRLEGLAKRSMEQDARLEVLCYIESIYGGEQIDISTEATVHEMLGRCLIDREREQPMTAKWKNLNARVWALKWIIKTEG